MSQEPSEYRSVDDQAASIETPVVVPEESTNAEDPTQATIASQMSAESFSAPELIPEGLPQSAPFTTPGAMKPSVTSFMTPNEPVTEVTAVDSDTHSRNVSGKRSRCAWLCCCF